MGLDAIVYSGKRTEVQVEGAQPGSEGQASGVRSNATAAIHKRLGNASMIGSIREEMLSFLDADALLLTKVLYSGSHSSDEISVQDIDKLDSEIKKTRQRSGTSLSMSVERFLNDMTDLVDKARQERSPIVFV